MKFVDQVRIFVKAGDGGNGAVAFRREKYVEKGGPSGGDGGKGGSVIMVGNPQLTTLLDFRYQQHHRAKNGEGGLGSDCNGHDAEDMVLQLPVGTLIKDANTDELLCDISEPDQVFIAAKGGRGGLGNMNFATSTRQTPRFAQDGTRGEERTIVLELKLLADVGLLGFPNAGKSTLISRVSRARPKVADYPFTTLVPNLGMVQYKDGLSFVMADIPGLIEGASEGIGLGYQFLRHVERCRVLIHVVDLSAFGEDRDPVKDFEVLNNELAKYSPLLATKPQVVAANKVDLPDAREKLDAFVAAMKRQKRQVFPISSATGEGIPKLLDAVALVLFAGKVPEGAMAARETMGTGAPTSEGRDKGASVASSASPQRRSSAAAKPRAAASRNASAKAAGKPVAGASKSSATHSKKAATQPRLPPKPGKAPKAAKSKSNPRAPAKKSVSPVKGSAASKRAASARPQGKAVSPSKRSASSASPKRKTSASKGKASSSKGKKSAARKVPARSRRKG